MGPDVVGVDGQRLIQAAPHLEKILFVERGMEENEPVSGPQVMVVGQPRRGRLGERALGLGLVHVHGKHRHDSSGDLVLDGKGVLKFAIVALGPAMGAGGGVDKLGTDADAVAGAANAALQHVARAKLTPDLSHVDALPLVAEARVAGDDEQLGEPRQLCDDVLGDTVAEVFLIRIATHAGEGENGDRRPFGPDALGHGPRAVLLLPRLGALMADDICGKEIAATRHRLDDLVLVVGDGRTHVTNAARQRLVGHHHLRPGRCNELLF
jgi:hypothetical protein